MVGAVEAFEDIQGPFMEGLRLVKATLRCLQKGDDSEIGGNIGGVRLAGAAAQPDRPASGSFPSAYWPRGRRRARPGLCHALARCGWFDPSRSSNRVRARR